MKFKRAAKKGNLLVEVESGNNRLINSSNGPITKLKEILVPIDFSDCSRHALRYAVAFAKQFNAQVTLVAVVNDAHTSFEVGNPDFIAAQNTRKQLYVDELNKLAASEVGKVTKTVVVRSGRPYEEIVLAAQELSSDLIVIATHGEMGMAKVQLGSTAERVIRYAPCPVLVVRQKEREFAAVD